MKRVKNYWKRLKKFFRKHEPRRKTIIIVSAVLIILLLTLLFLSLRIRFILQEDIVVELEPHHPLVNMTNDASKTLNFSVNTYNFFTCNSVCNVEIFNVSSNETVLSRNLTGERFSFNFSTPERGRGQLMYSITASCRNQKGKLCFTDNEWRRATTLVTLNYHLDNKEQKAKKQMKNSLPTLLESTREMLEFEKKAQAMTQRLPGSVQKKKISQFNKTENLKQKAQELRTHWDEKEYIKLKNRHSSDNLENVNNKIKSKRNVINKSLGLLHKHNENTKLLSIPKEELNNTKEFYIQNPNNRNRNRLLEMDTITANLLEQYENFKAEDYNISSVNEALKNLTARLNKRLKEFEKINNEGQKLLNTSNTIIHNKQLNITLNGSLCNQLNQTIEKFKLENKKVSQRRQRINITENLSRELENYTKLLTKNASFENQTLLNLTYINTTAFENFSKTHCSDRNFSYTPRHVNLLLNKTISTEKIDTNVPSVVVQFPTELTENKPQCCTYNECIDCVDNKSRINTSPVLFIHGHSFNEANSPEYTMNIFGEIERRLQKDGIINAGELYLSDETQFNGAWGRPGRKLAVKSSYYYITYYDLGRYSFTTRQSERIENYAIRLKEIISELKERYGAEKVDIVAHSMGGLVAREYIQLFGQDNVNKLITVNTPHNGIEGRVQDLCSVMGADRECEDMSRGSVFLKKLNSKPLPDLELHSIRSVGCSMKNTTGDGIVTNESAYVEGAINHKIEGNCTDTFNTNLHSQALDPEKYPGTYRIIREILLNSSS